MYLEAVVGAMRRSIDPGVCYADGNRKGRKQNGSFPPELPKPLLSGQPVKFSLALSALPAASVSTAVIDSEVAQIWVWSSPN